SRNPDLRSLERPSIQKVPAGKENRGDRFRSPEGSGSESPGVPLCTAVAATPNGIVGIARWSFQGWPGPLEEYYCWRERFPKLDEDPDLRGESTGSAHLPGLASV